MNDLKEGAQAVLNDESIDVGSRARLRYALETNDPWLAERCAQIKPKVLITAKLIQVEQRSKRSLK